MPFLAMVLDTFLLVAPSFDDDQSLNPEGTRTSSNRTLGSLNEWWEPEMKGAT